MSERPASEIRALIARLERTQWPQVRENLPDDMTYMNLHDVQCVLQIWEGLVGLREMVEDLLGYATEAGRPGRDRAAQIMLGETEGLEED